MTAFIVHPAGRRTASIFLTPVKIKLGARAAGAGAMLPEIIFFSQPDNTAGIHPDLLGPNVESLVVILVNGNPNPLNRQLQHLSAELPKMCIRDSYRLCLIHGENSVISPKAISVFRSISSNAEIAVAVSFRQIRNIAARRTN